MKRFAVYGLTCVLAIVAIATASATTIVLPTDEQLIAKSPVIVEATVVSSMPIARGNEIWTETKLAVDRNLKGNITGEVIVREIGGELDNRVTMIFGGPQYAAGEHVLAFLTSTPRGDYQTVDLFVGKFTEDRAMNGRRLWKRDTTLENVSLVDSDFHPIETPSVQRDGEAFETYIGDRVAGKKGAVNYGVENPLLDSDFPAGRDGHLPIKSNFTLISEPTIYRWFAFDRGSSARWYSFGTQPGYSGGGVSEVQTAMSGWNNVSGAKISYSYAGAGSGTPGGLSAANGVNEVLFNDPKGEIAGSWNPSTGGVVGQGGFNGVINGGNWTSPFAADAQHPQQTFHAYEITEGNLTIQDNVSSSTGISSTRLAEIVAHEFGHTLGLGHSSDSTALMYATVTGLGPTPRADDQLAVQWLYPSGSAPPPTGGTVPAAPTGLSGSSSGSTISLQWTRNSTNEGGFYVYVSYNSGTFTRISGSFPAGASSGALTQAAAGSYRIYLTAYNSAGESAASNTLILNVAGAVPLSASFSVSPSSGVAGQTVFSFSDQSTGNVVSRTWNFGDGFASTIANPTHVFAAAGQYVVYLMVSDGANQSQYSAAINVSTQTGGVPAVQASFDVNPTSPLAGTAASFIDRSAGSPTSWSWTFGDGSTSSQQNPSHTYATPGTYTVTLSISNGLTNSNASRSIVVAQSSILTLNTRYRISINARDQRSGNTAAGLANAQTSEFGYFSLPELTGDPNNPEVFVKVLGPVGDVPWVFFGGLTDLEYTLNVTDTQTGVVRTYHKDGGTAKGGYDTGSGQLPAGNCAANTIVDSRTGATRATATSSQLALLNNRFGMTLEAKDPRSGQTASGVTIPKNDESGFYTLPGLTGDANNVEVFVKIVNATSVDGHYWVFFGGLTDFEYTLTVSDTSTGKVRSYTKPAGSACGGFDTTGF